MLVDLMWPFAVALIWALVFALAIYLARTFSRLPWDGDSATEPTADLEVAQHQPVRTE
jgi:hypothetical protein